MMKLDSCWELGFGRSSDVLPVEAGVYGVMKVVAGTGGALIRTSWLAEVGRNLSSEQWDTLINWRADPSGERAEGGLILTAPGAPTTLCGTRVTKRSGWVGAVLSGCLLGDNGRRPKCTRSAEASDADVAGSAFATDGNGRAEGRLAWPWLPTVRTRDPYFKVLNTSLGADCHGGLRPAQRACHAEVSRS